MTNLDVRNQKIINAVVEKADRVCPGSLALIGIYGSFATGDIHEKSDLDLLILINDDRGWQLACTFIQDDLNVGHDIYCTTWESLQEDALCKQPNIAKLMDSEIVYCADEKYRERLDLLRRKANDILLAPFSREDYVKAEKIMKEAEHFYLLAMVAENMAETWERAGAAIYHIENALAMLNKRYFRYGTRRIYTELEAMEQRPPKLCERIESVLAADSAGQIRENLTVLIQETMCVFKKAEKAIPVQKKPVTKDSIRGTYEEMFSNWRNKMYLAAETDNRHLAFSSMLGLDEMISGIGQELDIAGHDVLGRYDPQNLEKSAQAYDDAIREYLGEYEKAGLQVERYQDIDEFVRKYRER